MTYYNFTDPQALHAATHDEMVVVVPIPRQPAESIWNNNAHVVVNIDETGRHICIWKRATDGVHYIVDSEPLPYPIGARVGLRSKNKTIAKGTVTSARVDRVQNLTSREVMDLTSESDNVLWRLWPEVKDWFNARYSKPCPIKENGEIVGYRAYSWDCKSFNYDKLTVNYTFDGWLWKGKPLTIHINPYVEIFTVTKE